MSASASGLGRANGELGRQAQAGLGGGAEGPPGPGVGSASEASGLEAGEDADSCAPGTAVALATDEEGNLLAPAKHPLRTYLEYLAYLYRKLEPLSEQERFEISYRDFLQAPLQVCYRPSYP